MAVDFDADRMVHQVSQLLGRSFDEVRQAVYHPELLLPFELGRISPQAYYEGLKTRLSLSWTYEQFVRSWNDILTENRDVVAILRRLHQRYRLIALSNTNELHINHIRTSIPSLTIFDDWVVSCDVGFRKPDPEIYSIALQRGGVRAQSTIYVDDRPELVDAGRAVGLAAIRFENSQQLEGELRAIGVNI